MENLVNNSLADSAISNWLQSHGLGWLVSEQAVSFVSIIVSAIVLYYIGWFVVKWVIRRSLRSTAKYHSWHRKDVEKREKTLKQIVFSIWKIIIFGYSIGLILNKVFMIDLSPIIASAGIIGVALGFGSQALVKDFLSGLFIIIENQYRVGDVVEMAGATGTVEKVGTRSTVLRDNEGNVHYIPNGTIQRVVNKTMGYSMSRFTIEVSSDNNIDEVTALINKVGEELAQDKKWVKKIIEPPKFLSISEISGKSTTLTIAGKTQPSDQWSVTSEMRHRLITEFEKNKISLS